MRVRPRARPTTAEIRNSTTAMKKMTLAISIEAPAMPPKPKMPAIRAMMRKVTTQLNITQPLRSIPSSFEPRPGASRLGYENNPELKRKFPLVPAPKTTKKAQSDRNNDRLCRQSRGGRCRGITPIQPAVDALYHHQSCYEGSPSRPRGAIVGGRRFA